MHYINWHFYLLTYLLTNNSTMRQRNNFNGPIANRTLRIEWSHDRWRHVTQKGKVVTCFQLLLVLLLQYWARNFSTFSRQLQWALQVAVGMWRIIWSYIVQLCTICLQFNTTFMFISFHSEVDCDRKRRKSRTSGGFVWEYLGNSLWWRFHWHRGKGCL